MCFDLVTYHHTVIFAFSILKILVDEVSHLNDKLDFICETLFSLNQTNFFPVHKCSIK